MSASVHDDAEVLWTPSADQVAAATMTRFLDQVQRDQGRSFDSYLDAWRWSIENPGPFWDSIWTFFGVVGQRGSGQPSAASSAFRGQWFPDARVNYAENALRTRNDRIALIAVSETGPDRQLTYAELAHQVAAVARTLRTMGVGPGDRVAGYLPNIPEAVVSFLATASIGAIWTSCSPDFGAQAVLARFGQVEPKVLIAADGYIYAGRAIDRTDVVAALTAGLPTVEHVITVPHLGSGALGRGHGDKVVAWSDACADVSDLRFEPVGFEDPLWILYSSGTTGIPKAIVHGHGSIVLEHLKTVSLHFDVGPGDRFFWFTTTGWMVWNVLVGGLLVGATVVLYDGSPNHPDLLRLWRIAEAARVTHFGASAGFIDASRKAGVRPSETLDLDGIRFVGSTGSPLDPEGFRWVYDAIGRDLLLGSVSGGTDVAAPMVGPSPILPVRAGLIQAPALGVAVEAFDDQCRGVVGEVGELVVTKPMPSMPLFFWGDPTGERLHASYFETCPGVWRHGDWIRIGPDGSCVILGRSDATINRGGIRMGSAEFYRSIEAIPEVRDTLVVDTSLLGSSGELIVFVDIDPAASMGDDELGDTVRARLRHDLSPRHVPDRVVIVPGIPRTLTGKKLELPIRKILLGTPADVALSRGAVDRPELIEVFERLAGNLGAARDRNRPIAGSRP